MKIGIISDTHNNISLTQKAIDIFVSEGVDFIIHAGDVSSPKMLELFTKFNCRFVLGNGDIDVEAINLKSREIGFGDVKEICELELDGKYFLIFHGNDVPTFRNAVSSGKYNYIIKGHTHIFEDYMVNSTHIINPGSLLEGDDNSVAVLDTEKDKVLMIRLDDSE